ncbi:hypothetical protein PoB_005771900 [Plakobranchus ocellatus]|uniref:Uncharacterized protein n=1 Tax=Plakobranchus ocellatus TaxID=259542 RepID=A0AAV4CK04_9GAST|nr:hypothetical protein PoB_005771900 [Plakobranchus ocellatus]
MTVGQSVAAYPGHGGQATPRGGPRVKPEGECNYIKNQGTVKQKLFDDKAPIVRTPKPSPRCPTSASKHNYKQGWFGNISPMLNGTASPRPNTAPPRVKPEAEVTANQGRGPRMKIIVNEYARKKPTPRQPRVKPEAEGTAEVSKGGRMNNLLHKYGTLPSSARLVPRLKLEAESIAQHSRGWMMNDTLHKYGRNRVSPRPEPRVKPEAEDNATLDKGKRMGIIMHKYAQGPMSARAVPRVKNEGESNANLDRGIRMSRLMHSPMSMPGTPRPVPRTNTSQAQENAFKGRGSMDQIFSNMAQKTFIYVPGQQAKMYTRASIC